MVNIQFFVDLDLIDKYIPAEDITVVQESSQSIEFFFSIKKNKSLVDLTGATDFVFALVKPDGHVVLQDDAVLENGKVKVLVNAEAFTAKGKIFYQIQYKIGSAVYNTRQAFAWVEQGNTSCQALKSTDYAPFLEGPIELGKIFKDVDTPALIASKEVADAALVQSNINSDSILHLNDEVDNVQGVAESALEKSTENTSQIGVLSENIGDNESFLGGDIKAIWDPPTQPARDSIIADVDNRKYSKYLDLWDNLVSGNEEYITKTKLGRDQSNTYDIYKYVFEPKNYEKTIIVNCNIHGHETMGHLMFYQFMKLVVNNYKKSSQLNYIRNKIRVVTIPVQNPWGLENFTRGNSRQVNLNRNFDYLWSLNTETDKGAAPLSEAEAVITNNLLKDYKDAVIYLDLHNTESGMDYNYYAVIPKYLDISRDIIYKTIQAVSPIKNPNNNIQTSEQPVVANNGVANHGIQSAIIEWVPGTMSPASYDSTDMTYAVKFIGNLILQFLANENINLGRVSEAVTSHTTYITRAKTTGTGWTKMGLMDIEFAPKVDGIVLVNGTTVCKNTDDTAMSYIAPVVVQTGNDMTAPGTIAVQQDQAEVFAEIGLKMSALSYSRTMPVRAVGKDNGTVKVSLYMKSTAGILANERTRLSVTFIPTNAAVSYKTFVTVGATGEIKQSYPDPTKM